MTVEAALLWIASASMAGFALAALFAGSLRFRRNLYLLFYVPLAGALVVGFFRSNRIGVADLLRHNWVWGLVAAGLVTALVVKNVLSQPPTPRRRGMALVVDILWPGLAYGLVDALLLSVLPVLAVTLAFAGADWTVGWPGQIGVGGLALLASLIVAGVYHLGYPEFRGPSVLGAMVGNGVMSLAYVLTMNPLAAVLPHMIMHVAAILHGRESTYQLPPHYGMGEEKGGSGGEAHD
jgi:hypothetical protein